MAGTEVSTHGIRCERARHCASLRVDGELSALEEQLLERHLGVCEACRAFDEGVLLATGLLRAAPPEVPSQRFRPPARAVRFRVVRHRTAFVAAAALVLGVLAGSLLQRPSEPEPRAPAQQVSFLSRDFDQLRELPRVEKKHSPAPIPSGPPNPPEGVI
ncbi:MAG: zf-HC2 domain-containing protein [Gaiellaceae bacterium]